MIDEGIPATVIAESRPGLGLALIGYRGTGKSTIGRLLARRTGRPFVDADREVERRSGRSIRSLFAEEGEAAFRDWESTVLSDLTTHHDLILATGGGAILREVNRLALRRFGLVVWLTASLETLTQRLARDAQDGLGRPSLTSAGTLNEIQDVLSSRIPLYRQTSDLEIDSEGLSAGGVTDIVWNAWLDWRASGGRKGAGVRS